MANPPALNRRGARGFSFRHYATKLVTAGKSASCPSTAPPSPENIRTGRYPFVTTSYLVTTDTPRPTDLQRHAASF